MFLFTSIINFKKKRESPNIEDWNDPIQNYFCLFCKESFENEDDILSHMIKDHKYDLKSNLTKFNLSFYNQVKLINYMRQQVLEMFFFIIFEKRAINILYQFIL